MTGDDLIKARAISTAWREGHAHGGNAMMAILFVIRNHVVTEGGWGHAVQKVDEFSYLTYTVVDYLSVPDIRDPEVQRLLRNVDAIYDDSAQDKLTNGALYFADFSNPLYSPAWFGRLIDGRERVAAIGNLSFFR